MEWKTEATVARYQNQLLVRMVQLAKQVRIQNMNITEITKRTIQEKAKMIQSGDIQFTTMCSGGQIRLKDIRVFEQVNLGLNDPKVGPINDENLLGCFMIFSTMIYCSVSGPFQIPA